jgi:hypothetical protein
MNESLTNMETDENMKGYVYMVIPEELKNTDRVKIGMSKLNNDSRIKSYGKNVKLIIKFNCDNPIYIEKKIINTFKENFKLIKGNEYFEGDIKEMKKIFIQQLQLYLTENYIQFVDKYVNENDIETENNEYNNNIISYELWNKRLRLEFKIINKTTGEGFYRFPDRLWRKLHSSYEENDEENDKETLIGCVTHFNDSFNDNKKIYNDIINKCYVNNIKYYDLESNKFIIDNNNKIFIFNSLTLEFIPLNEEIKSMILVEMFRNTFELKSNLIINFNHINSLIVDKLLDNLVNENIKIKYKIFMKNLLNGNEGENIFYDDDCVCLLSSWCKDILTSLGKRNNIICSDEFYNNKKEFNKIIKKYNPKLLLLKNHPKFSLSEPDINSFSKYNFKNIIICKKIKKMYNQKQFMAYLQSKECEIIDIINNQNNSKVMYRINYEDQIFRNSEYLQINFLKWILL